ncbi:Integral membrane protein 2A [Larimichthys crocea]|uniref:Uncharacterized protein n=1 Tax=Larimichthys crocea TaxID=215358 RepID=A0ACD3RD41_LARCR|nr:Integral membrane protein 2A [Larimichthys crocea]
MVKIAFNSALAQKALGKEVPSAVTDPELASAPAGNEGSTGRCLLTLLGIAFILSGLIVGGACLYRYFTPKRLYHGAMQFSDVSGGAGGESQPYYLPRVEEEMEISDSMAVISVPPPRFRPGDPAYILHDFNRKLTAYLDLTLRTCFVIPLNTSVVLPPSGPHRPLLAADVWLISQLLGARGPGGDGAYR